MKLLRLIAVILALSLMIGELWRSWGAGRHWLFVIDDQIMGALLLAGAVLVARDTLNRRAFFAAAWGVNAGMLYGSFFGKLVDPASSNAGNWDIGILTALLGIAFVTSVIGMIASFLLPPSGETK